MIETARSARPGREDAVLPLTQTDAFRAHKRAANRTVFASCIFIPWLAIPAGAHGAGVSCAGAAQDLRVTEILARSREPAGHCGEERATCVGSAAPLEVQAADAVDLLRIEARRPERYREVCGTTP